MCLRAIENQENQENHCSVPSAELTMEEVTNALHPMPFWNLYLHRPFVHTVGRRDGYGSRWKQMRHRDVRTSGDSILSV